MDNKFLKVAILSLAPIIAFADSTSTATNTANSNASGGQGVGALTAAPVSNASSFSGATNQGLQQGVTLNQPNNSVAQGADLSKAVGNAFAPALTTTLTETCMGSTSVGGGFAGGAFSFGTTWRDSACVRRLDAREIKSFGDVQAAKEIMCDSDLVKAAFKRVGRPCYGDGGNYTVVVQNQTKTITQSTNPPASAERVSEEQAIKDHNKWVLEEADRARAKIRNEHGF